jgi:predicted Ser/Thr protein kinase
MIDGVPETETATLPDAPGAFARASQPEVGGTLGRFRIERTLGEGGMGVVYLAFDPVLERHIALKVLREERVATDARPRLLREARALAQLAHPNVVTVHEVGFASGRDYVAMELVDGQTVAAWLAERARTPAEILDVFVAAGRGLAAAHAAGLVHRDFKPNNVLRARGGRVVVTDFGLARGADARAEEASDPATPEVRPSLREFTATGQHVGTPAYMAPEQWGDGTIGPAADQFAFCVALWEALTGQRPFRSDDGAAAAAELDASRLPRWIRPLLVRGLAAAPADRWPSLEALLARLAVRRRRPLVLGLSGLALTTITLGAYGVFGGHGREPAAGAACELAALPAPVGELPGKPAVAQLLAHAAAELHTTALRACGLPPAYRRGAIACLDRVVPRLDLVRRAAAGVAGDVVPDAVALWLVEPALCLRPAPPHLTLAGNAETQSAVAIALRAVAHHDTAIASRDSLPASSAAESRRGSIAADAITLSERAADPCARAIAGVTALDISSDDAAAATTRPKNTTLQAMIASRASATTLAGDRCADDAIRAVLAIAVARGDLERGGSEDRSDEQMAVVSAAVARVPQDLLVASEWVLDAAVREQHDRIGEALALTGRAIDRFASRGFARAAADAESLRLHLYLRRATPDDVRAMRREIAAFRSHAADPAHLADVDRADAFARLLLGDVAGARTALREVWTRTDRTAGPQRIAGRVVDRAGHPVAGATVYAGPLLVAAGAGDGILPGVPADVSAVTTGADGRFAIPNGPALGGVIAIAGDARSPPAAPGEALQLVVGPTRTIRGRFVLGDTPPTRVLAVVTSSSLAMAYDVISPVAADGSFVIEGAPVEDGKLAAMIGFGLPNSELAGELALPAGTAPLASLVLPLANPDRQVYVIVRSTLTVALASAMVAIERGDRPHALHFRDVVRKGPPLKRQFASAPYDLPPDVQAQLRPGDLVATFTRVPDERLSACAMALVPDYPQLEPHAMELEIRCVPLPRGAAVVLVETPPQRRFD